MSTDPEKEGFKDIVIAFLEVLRKLDRLPKNEIMHILQIFVRSPNNQSLVKKLHGVLI